jgi:hypothetical protein
MSYEKTEKIAAYIIEQIISDISDRSGIGNEWETIDEDIQSKIKQHWEVIIVAALNGDMN